jgi:hypothetical protein
MRPHATCTRTDRRAAQSTSPSPGWHHRSDEQVRFAPLPGDRYPAPGYAPPDLPPGCPAPAGQPHPGPDGALPPDPSRSARPAVRVTVCRSRTDAPRVVGPTSWQPSRRMPTVTESTPPCLPARASSRRYVCCPRIAAWSQQRPRIGNSRFGLGSAGAGIGMAGVMWMPCLVTAGRVCRSRVGVL